MRNVAAFPDMQECYPEDSKSYIVDQTCTDMHGDTVLAAVGAG